MARYGTNHAGGRPKGSLSEKTLQAQAVCRSICEDPEYVASLLQRARSGNLGSMEPVIWAYAWGKPKESVDLRVGRIEDDLSHLSTEELTLRAMEMVRQLREVQEEEQAIPADYRVRASHDTSNEEDDWR
jgi:hypothetical protein